MALRVGIPVYDELVDAAHALRAVRWIEQQWGFTQPVSPAQQRVPTQLHQSA